MGTAIIVLNREVSSSQRLVIRGKRSSPYIQLVGCICIVSLVNREVSSSQRLVIGAREVVLIYN